MQILKDTAALAIILLLALTLRIDTGRPPIELDLTTPVEAAESGTSERETGRPAEIQAEIVRLADHRPGCCEEMEPRRLLVIEPAACEATLDPGLSF